MTAPPATAAAVLSANDAFYAAFAGGDVDAMNDIWAVEHPVSCLHPGWPIIIGRQQVLASWRGILRSPPPIRQTDAQVLMYDGIALVVCREVIGANVLAASTLYVQESAVWRLAHHQAGATTGDDIDPEAGQPPRAIH